MKLRTTHFLLVLAALGQCACQEQIKTPITRVEHDPRARVSFPSPIEAGVIVWPTLTERRGSASPQALSFLKWDSGLLPPPESRNMPIGPDLELWKLYRAVMSIDPSRTVDVLGRLKGVTGRVVKLIWTQEDGTTCALIDHSSGRVGLARWRIKTKDSMRFTWVSPSDAWIPCFVAQHEDAVVCKLMELVVAAHLSQKGITSMEARIRAVSALRTVDAATAANALGEVHKRLNATWSAIILDYLALPTSGQVESLAAAAFPCAPEATQTRANNLGWDFGSDPEQCYILAPGYPYFVVNCVPFSVSTGTFLSSGSAEANSAKKPDCGNLCLIYESATSRVEDKLPSESLGFTLRSILTDVRFKEFAGAKFESLLRRQFDACIEVAAARIVGFESSHSRRTIQDAKTLEQCLTVTMELADKLDNLIFDRECGLYAVNK